MKRKRFRSSRLLPAALLLSLGLLLLLLLTLGKAAEKGTQTPSATAQDDGNAAGAATEQGLPSGWEQRELPARALAEGTLVLVNADCAFDAATAQTVNVYENKTGSYLVKDVYLSLTPETMSALNRWMDDFSAESGKTDVNVVAGWRSYDEQLELYQNAVDTKGQTYADAWLARPGHSEHHTGLALDLSIYDLEDGTSRDFDGSGDYARAVETAWKYGFVQRYPPQKSDITGIDYESWHYRYVGLPHAFIMKTENLCLEEYIEYLRNFPFSGDHLFVTCLGQDYEIYFCRKDQLVVPSYGAYEISGNNIDGFIVILKTFHP